MAGGRWTEGSWAGEQPYQAVPLGFDGIDASPPPSLDLDLRPVGVSGPLQSGHSSIPVAEGPGVALQPAWREAIGGWRTVTGLQQPVKAVLHTNHVLNTRLFILGGTGELSVDDWLWSCGDEEEWHGQAVPSTLVPVVRVCWSLAGAHACVPDWQIERTDCVDSGTGQCLRGCAVHCCAAASCRHYSWLEVRSVACVGACTSMRASVHGYRGKKRHYC